MIVILVGRVRTQHSAGTMYILLLVFLGFLSAAPAGMAGELPHFLDCSDCPDMVVLPAGTFVMGRDDGRAAEAPAHPVTIPAPFAIARMETSFEHYDACVAAAACPAVEYDRGWGRGERPVIYVDWHAAQAYADWLSARTGRRYRLPTEVEWEYAAQGGTGDRQGGAGRANCQRCIPDWTHSTFLPGRYAPNGFGLVDMLGNVMEWTVDCWRPSHAQGAAQDCSQRVWRGGSWYFNADVARSTQRFAAKPDMKGYDVGFRLAADP